jgi:hypothetical protein
MRKRGRISRTAREALSAKEKCKYIKQVVQRYDGRIAAIRGYDVEKKCAAIKGYDVEKKCAAIRGYDVKKKWSEERVHEKVTKNEEEQDYARTTAKLNARTRLAERRKDRVR